MGTPDGNFWLSFVVEQEQPEKFSPSTEKVGGFEFRSASFLYERMEGETIDSPQFFSAMSGTSSGAVIGGSCPGGVVRLFLIPALSF